MIKSFAEAKILHDALTRATNDISDATLRIWGQMSQSERYRVRHAMALILGELRVEGLRPLEKCHPMLGPADLQC